VIPHTQESHPEIKIPSWWHEAVARYLEHLAARAYSPMTRRQYTRTLDRFGRWLFTFYPQVGSLAQVARDHIQAYQIHLASVVPQKGHGVILSRATQCLYLTALRMFFRYLVRSNYLVSDPTRNLFLPRMQAPLPKGILTVAEMRRLLVVPPAETAVGLRDRALYELLYVSGMRIGEALALGLHDLNLSMAQVLVRGGKGGKDRLLPLGEMACIALDRYLRRGRVELARDGRSERLFVASSGQPLSAIRARRDLHRYAQTANIQKTVTPHLLRHTCATHLLQGRAGLRHIQALLGHAHLSTIQIYTRLDLSELRVMLRRCHPREQPHWGSTPSSPNGEPFDD